MLRGIRSVKIWLFWGAEHIYAIARCLAHIPNVSTFVWTLISPLQTSEWPFDQRFCCFPKDNFFGTSCTSQSVCLSIHMSVHHKNPSTSQNWSYQPSSLSTIKPIDHWAYWPMSLSTIKPINHQTYQSLVFFHDFQAFRLVPFCQYHQSMDDWIVRLMKKVWPSWVWREVVTLNNGQVWMEYIGYLNIWPLGLCTLNHHRETY